MGVEDRNDRTKQADFKRTAKKIVTSAKGVASVIQDKAAEYGYTVVRKNGHWVFGAKGLEDVSIVVEDGPVQVAPEDWKVAALVTAAEGVIDLSNLFVTKRDLLLGNIIARQKLCIMGAVSGIGKSTICIALAMATAAGRKRFGIELHEGALHVGYISTEDETEEVRRLVAATSKAHKWRKADIEDRLSVFGYDKLPNWFKLIGVDSKTRQPEIDEDAISWIKEVVRANQMDLLMIDPLFDLSGGFELSPQMMNMIANALKSVAQELNMAILLVHHMRKGSNSAAPNPEDISGGLPLVNASRATVTLRRLTNDEAQKWDVEEKDRKVIRVLDTGKVSLGPDGGRFFFRIEPVQLTDHKTGESFEIQAAAEWWPPQTTSGFHMSLWPGVVERIDAEEIVLFAETTKKNTTAPTLSQIVQEVCNEAFAEDGGVKHDAKSFEKAIRERGLVIMEKKPNPRAQNKIRKVQAAVVSDAGREQISL